MERPIACGRDFDIRVSATGSRKLAVGRQGLARGACEALTAADEGAATCPEVSVGFLAAQAIDALTPRGVTTGWGLSPCGDVRAAEDDWLISVKVNDWKHADAAVAAVVAQLQKWNIRGSLGVSVVSQCPVVELGR